MTRTFVSYLKRHGAAPVEGEFRAEWEGSNTLERHIAEAKAMMGADRWHELMQDWEAE